MCKEGGRLILLYLSYFLPLLPNPLTQSLLFSRFSSSILFTILFQFKGKEKEFVKGEGSLFSFIYPIFYPYYKSFNPVFSFSLSLLFILKYSSTLFTIPSLFEGMEKECVKGRATYSPALIFFSAHITKPFNPVFFFPRFSSFVIIPLPS